MAKLITIVPVNGCIRYKGTDYLPDTPFACETDEATRLINMEVAVAVKAEKAPTPAQLAKAAADKAAADILAAEEEAAAQKAAILEAIAAAVSVEELAALVPDEEPGAEIQEAFATRMAELEAGA